MLISDSYQELNKQLHLSNAAYGTTAPKYVQHVQNLIDVTGAKNVLDYGSGKGLLGQALSHLMIQEYDPGIEGKGEPPAPATVVVCIDVLEHIEPECLDDVLDDLKRVTQGACFITVSTRPAVKFLADGRNAHLIVEEIDWWLPQLIKRFSPRLIQVLEGEYIFMGERKEVGNGHA